jgi:bacteriorhodopsin
LITIGVSHMLMLIYDLTVLRPSKAYAAMRMRITSLVLGSHMMMVWLFYFVI